MVLGGLEYLGVLVKFHFQCPGFQRATTQPELRAVRAGASGKESGRYWGQRAAHGPGSGRGGHCSGSAGSSCRTLPQRLHALMK